MKELSIEEKAKCYDSIIERLKDFHFQYRFSSFSDDIEENFPELKESEDERIRKELIEHFRWNAQILNDIDNKDVIAWLEKQGEQKHDLIIPKFRIGDEIKTSNEESLTITKIDEKGYWSEDLFICNFDDATKWVLVEQKPAWSEEDEKMFEHIIAKATLHFSSINCLDEKEINFLKSLKDRVQPKQERSEEDENIIVKIKTKIAQCNGFNKKNREEVFGLIDSLRPQNTWKPCDYELEVLKLAAEKDGTCLMGLYEQLKKLREE